MQVCSIVHVCVGKERRGGGTQSMETLLSPPHLYVQVAGVGVAVPRVRYPYMYMYLAGMVPRVSCWSTCICIMYCTKTITTNTDGGIRITSN